MEGLPADLQAFLLNHPFFQLSDNKIKCTLNGHEFPCNLAELQNFIKGKKYQKLSAVSEFGYSQHEPHIVPSSKQPNQLFCKLTLRHLNRQPQHVLKHVSGKRYKKALERYKQCIQQGIEFVPARLQRKRRQEEGGGEVKKGSSRRNALWEPSSGDEDHSDSEDSMSDLYPPSMFPEKAEEEGGEKVEVVVKEEKDEDDFQTDDDDEEMVVENQAPQKRKKFQGGGVQKKFKNNKFKRRGVKSQKVKNGN